MALDEVNGQPSKTALTVLMFTTLGGTESDPAVRVDDPIGPQLLRWNDKGYGLGKATRLHPWLRRKAEQFGPGTYGFMVARLHYMDEVIRQEASQGLDQLVMLGAGYDTRAYRMGDDLAGVRVFEVDHPATSRDKRRRLKKALGKVPDDVMYAEADFTQQNFLNRLGEHGYDESARTLFVLSGVSMYLPEESLSKLFTQIAAHSSPRTSILFDYFFDDAMTDPERYYGAREWIAHATKAGEDPQWGTSMEEIDPMLQSHGLRLVSQRDMAELAGRYLRRADGTFVARPYDFAAVAHATTRD